MNEETREWQRAPRQGARRGVGAKLLWFVLLWLAGVAVVGALAWLIRLAIL